MATWSGDRLKSVRVRLGLSGAEVEQRTQIGQSSLSAFETGQREPKLSQLKKLADLYRRPISFLLDPGPMPQEVVLWRARPDNAPQIEAEFLRLCDQYHRLETWCGERVPPTLKAERADPGSFGRREARALAKRVRDELQLGDRPGCGLLRVLEEECGVKVFHLDTDSDGTAACSRSDAFGMAVLLNPASVAWRRNFDLAHELFHLLTWDVFRSGSDASSQETKEEEKLATCFAGNLLLPVEPLRRDLEQRSRGSGYSFDAIIDVARLFDVSVDAVLWQMHFEVLHRGPADQAQTLKDIEAVRRWESSREGRTGASAPPSRPARFEALAKRSLWEGHISTGKYAEFMGISRQKAMEVAAYGAELDGSHREIEAPAA